MAKGEDTVEGILGWLKSRYGREVAGTVKWVDMVEGP